MNKWLQASDILKEITEIGTYRGSIDPMSGVLEWYDKEKDITIMATPNWETDGEVPFDVTLSDGEYYNVVTIKMVKGEPSTQLTHYLNVLMMVMNHYSGFPKKDLAISEK